jgi:hypothetical protein
MAESLPASTARFGTHGSVLIVDLTTRTTRGEEVKESISPVRGPIELGR